MGPHVKTQLRDGIEAHLRSAVPALNTVCSSVRTLREVQSHEYPAAALTVTETAETIGGGPVDQRPIKRTMRVTIALADQLVDIDTIEAHLEAIQADIEAALQSSEPFGVLGVKDWGYVGSESVEVAIEANLGVQPISYICFITTKPGQPDTAI